MSKEKIQVKIEMHLQHIWRTARSSLLTVSVA